MVLSGLPIVSRAWVRSILRRSTADDPTINIYHTAKYVLGEVLGRDWVARHIESRLRGTGGFFRSNFSNDPEIAFHLHRVISLADMMINLQRIPGFSECSSQLKNPSQIEATYAESEVGKLLFIHRVRFEFHKRTGVRRRDFDLRIWCPNGCEAVADTKCKAETGQPSENTINHSLDRARQQLPDGTPGIVFIKVPRLWIEDEAYAASLRNIALEFMNGTSRVVSVKFYVTSVITDIDNITDILAVQEVNTERSDFGYGIDWKLFPTVPVTDPESLLMSVGWFLLQNSGTGG